MPGRDVLIAAATEAAATVPLVVEVAVVDATSLAAVPLFDAVPVTLGEAAVELAGALGNSVTAIELVPYGSYLGFTPLHNHIHVALTMLRAPPTVAVAGGADVVPGGAEDPVSVAVDDTTDPVPVLTDVSMLTEAVVVAVEVEVSVVETVVPLPLPPPPPLPPLLTGVSTQDSTITTLSVPEAVNVMLHVWMIGFPLLRIDA